MSNPSVSPLTPRAAASAALAVDLPDHRQLALAGGAAEGPPTLSVAGPIARITLQRPGRMNRLHHEDLLALQRHVEQLATHAHADGDWPELRVLILQAEGRAFCAGAHLAELHAHGPDTPRLFEETLDALARLPLPSVCRLQGGVYGGATDLALACDFRIGSTAIELRMPAVRFGLHYYPGGLQRAVARLGLAAAKRLFLRAQTLPAEALLALGYLDELVEPEALDDAVNTLAAELALGAPLAMQGMKRALDDIATGRYQDAEVRARIRDHEARCAASADLQEGLSAFAEKRAPVFTGR
jgi:enoyl-CoA hydratase